MALTAPPNVQVTAQAVPAEEQTTLLELAIYNRYNRQGQLYVSRDEHGRPQHYRFTLRQAAILLQETDEVDGRPVWRRPRPIKTPEQVRIDLSQPVIQDVRTDRVNEQRVDDTARIGLPSSRIEDGDEAELAALGLSPQVLDALDGGETTQV